MSKKLLILVDKIGEKKEFFAGHLGQKIPDAKVFLARFSDLIFEVNGKDISVRLEKDGGNLADFDLVYFRRAGTKFLSVAGSLAVCLDYFGIDYLDRTYQNLGPCGDKFTSLIRLATAGLPVMPSYFCWHTLINEKKDEIGRKLGFPLVAKQLSSQKGRGVLLIKNSAGFTRLEKEFPEEEFLFQKYYPSKAEYRLLVLEDTIGSFEEKIKVGDEFRANIALGAKEKFIDQNKVPPEMKKIAIDACQTLNIQIGGVDILVDQTGKLWLLEINRGPGLTYDPVVSPELDSLAEYFSQKIKKIK